MTAAVTGRPTEPEVHDDRTDPRQGIGVVVDAGQAEIEDFDYPPRRQRIGRYRAVRRARAGSGPGDDEVIGLDVAVDQSALVCVL